MRTNNQGGIKVKKMLKAFLAAFFLVGGIVGLVKAEGILDNSPGKYRLYKSSTVPSGSNVVSKSAYLYKVVVTSPSASTLDIYNNSGTNANKFATIQVSTNEFTGPKSYEFGVYLSSGIRAVHTAGGTLGDVSIIYADKYPPNNATVWKSTFGAVNTSTQTIARGPVLLHSVKVLKKGAGTTVLRIYDQYTTSVNANQKIAEIDLTNHQDYTFDVLLSSGLTYNVNSTGSSAADIMMLYKVNPPRSYEMWTSTYTSGSVTNRSVFAGRGVFGGAINGTVAATSMLTVRDSNGTATKPIGSFIGSATYGAVPYDVVVSSGLTVTSVGSGTYTIRYKRLRP